MSVKIFCRGCTRKNADRNFFNELLIRVYLRVPRLRLEQQFAGRFSAFKVAVRLGGFREGIDFVNTQF